MSLKYNSTTNIITTDDITVSSDLNNLGKTVSEVLLEQNEKLSKLSSNVKWLAKYGGVGGSGTGGGGSQTQHKGLKFDVRISYTDMSNNSAIANLSQLSTNEQILLVKNNTQVTISITIISDWTLSPDSYYATLEFGNGSSVSQQFKPENHSCQISFRANNPDYFDHCTLSVLGEGGVKTVQFVYYTNIVNNFSGLYNGDILLQVGSSIYNSYKENLNFKIKLESLIESLYKVEVNDLKINNEIISINSNDINTAINLSSYFNEFGIYNIQLKYSIIDLGTGIPETSPVVDYQYIYKSPDQVFIRCFSNLPDVQVLSSNESKDVGSKLKQIPLKYIIYGTMFDSPTTQYNVQISVGNNEFVSLGTKKLLTEYNYSLENTASNLINQEIVFKINNYEQSYYIPIDRPDDIKYIFTNSKGDNCYNCLGYCTDDLNFDSKVITFPQKTQGEKFFRFTQTQSCTLRKIVGLQTSITNSDLSHSVLAWVQNSAIVELSGTSYRDVLFQVGINFQDKNYNKEIFSICDKNSNKITFYRNKIKYGSSISDKFCFPQDDEFHLITIYIKGNYDISGTSGLVNVNPYFQIYIDGIGETIPIEFPAFQISNDMSIELNESDSYYNLIGIYTLNAINVDPNFHLNIGDTIWKYYHDFDPILVSNYAMVYHNQHIDDKLYDEQELKNTYEFTDDQFPTLSDYNSLLTKNSCTTNSWINYYPTNTVQHKKFIPVNVQQFFKYLYKNDSGDSEILMLRLVPEYNASDISNGLHISIANTYKSYGENDKDADTHYYCKLQKYVKIAENTYNWVDYFDSKYTYTYPDSLRPDDSVTVRFYFKFQGSSTLHYSIKNFEISTETQSSNQYNTEYDTYFNLDDTTFKYPEKSFNLKADLVDSSSCTNNVIGNFVNNYMKSPFGDEYQSCLSGRPVLLFIENNVSADNNDTFFLGIYNLNLNRGSLNNLGYQSMKNYQEQPGKIPNSSIRFQSSDNIKTNVYPNKLYVAEIAGNSPLFDFSQYNPKLLADKMFGDYYVYIAQKGVIEKNEYNNDLFTVMQAHASKMYTILSPYFNLSDYKLDTFTNYLDTYKSQYYYNDNNARVLLPNNIRYIISASDVDNIYTYREIKNNISVIGNPNYQFTPIYDNEGRLITTPDNSSGFMAIREVSNSFNFDTEDSKFDLHTTIQYYIICMAFAMVDSVQKNLTIKRAYTNTWYPEFYDMDTGIGIDNAGHVSDWKAFSDYISGNSIIQDYVPTGTGGWFDTPSSYLFMYAKYFSRLRNDGGPIPYDYWCCLRGKEDKYSSQSNYPNIYHSFNELKDAKTFCNNYLYKYIGNKIPPLVWNLNYQYKYFSQTLNTDATDTELSRFNGTMKWKRLDWMNSRLHLLDALFGIANPINIGSSNILIHTDNSINTANTDIEICQSMVPYFKKGASFGFFNVDLKGEARIPVIFRTSTSSSILRITDDYGQANISTNINTSVEMGFFGSKHLYEVSECGQFLGNPDTNTIQNDMIEKLVIYNSRAKKIEQNLQNIPSIKEIIIGTQSQKANFSSSFTFQSSDKKILNKLEINNVEFTEDNGFAINNCIFNECALKNSTIPELNFDSCTFKQNLNLDSSLKIYKLKINGCVIPNLTINSNSEITVVIENSEISNLELNCPRITKIIINGTSINSIKNKYISNLNEISIKNLKCSEVILHSEFYNKYTNSENSSITAIILQNITNEENLVNLSLGGFTQLITLTCTSSRFKLCNGGIAKSKLASIPVQIEEFDTNISYAFVECFQLNIDTSFINKLSNCTNLDHTFAQHRFIKTSGNITLDLLNSILKQRHKNDNLDGTFFGYQFMSYTSSHQNSNTIGDNLIQTDKATGTFYGSSVIHFTSKMAKKLSSYDCFIGGEGNQYFESTSLSNFTYIRDMYDDLIGFIQSNVYPSNQFYTQVDSTYQIVEYVKYITEFPKATNLMFDVLTTEKISLELPNDYTSVPLQTYNGIHKYASKSYCNVKNLIPFLKFIYPKVNTFLSEFRCSRIVEISNLSECIDLYELLYSEQEFNDQLFRRFIQPQQDYYDYWSFFKKINYDKFNQLLTDLRNNNITEIAYLFSNCLITDCPDEISLKLYGFTNLCKTFANCIFLDSSNNPVYVNLDKCFEDTDGKTTQVQTLNKTFTRNNLKAFSDVGVSLSLGISDLSVENMVQTFFYCSYKYNENYINKETTYINDNLIHNIDLPSDPFTILPENFLNFVKPGVDLSFAFSQVDSRDKTYVLKGYLPEAANYFGCNLIGESIFFKCFIVYHNFHTDGSNQEYWGIFPEWYSNLNSTNKFAVSIPLPYKNSTGKNRQFYLFESNKEINSYDAGLPVLQKMSSTNQTSQYISYGLNTTDNQVNILYPAYEATLLPESKDGKYGKVLTLELSLVLGGFNKDSTIFVNFHNSIDDDIKIISNPTANMEYNQYYFHNLGKDNVDKNVQNRL